MHSTLETLAEELCVVLACSQGQKLACSQASAPRDTCIQCDFMTLIDLPILRFEDLVLNRQLIDGIPPIVKNNLGQYRRQNTKQQFRTADFQLYKHDSPVERTWEGVNENSKAQLKFVGLSL